MIMYFLFCCLILFFWIYCCPAIKRDLNLLSSHKLFNFQGPTRAFREVKQKLLNCSSGTVYTGHRQSQPRLEKVNQKKTKRPLGRFVGPALVRRVGLCLGEELGEIGAFFRGDSEYLGDSQEELTRTARHFQVFDDFALALFAKPMRLIEEHSDLRRRDGPWAGERCVIHKLTCQ